MACQLSTVIYWIVHFSHWFEMLPLSYIFKKLNRIIKIKYKWKSKCARVDKEIRLETHGPHAIIWGRRSSFTTFPILFPWLLIYLDLLYLLELVLAIAFSQKITNLGFQMYCKGVVQSTSYHFLKCLHITSYAHFLI